MFNKFLIPVDGSNPAKRAAKYGLELAVKYDAPVDLLYVVETGRLTDDEAKKRERGNAILEEVMELDIDGAPSIETHLTEGNPSSVISEHVADNDIDLVVMGRHGRTGVGEHMFGTVAERVLRSVETPILTVAGDQIQRETGRTYEDILLTTDGSEVAERAAPYSADIAQRTGGTLHLITAVDVKSEAGPFDAGGITDEYREQLESEGQDSLNQIIEEIDTTNVDLQSSLVKGTPSTEIATYTDENDIDLIVMASEGETNLVGQYTGSTTRQVLRTVTRPVLVVPIPD